MAVTVKKVMKQALSLGNRTIMMNDGEIVLDVSDIEKKKMTTDDLLNEFKTRIGRSLDNDRMLLSE